MRSVACLVLVASLGCGARNAHRTMRYSEITLAGALIGVLASSLAMAALPDHKDAIIPITIGFGVVGLGAFGCYLAADLAEDDHPMTPLQHADEEAWALTQRAETAARAGDCAKVDKISPKVHDLDADFHVKVFSRDVAIARCLKPH